MTQLLAEINKSQEEKKAGRLSEGKCWVRGPLVRAMTTSGDPLAEIEGCHVRCQIQIQPRFPNGWPDKSRPSNASRPWNAI